GSAVARLLGRRWHYVDPVQHLRLFTRDNLRRLLEAAGFEVLAVRALGHRYRLRYVMSRLRYLHPHGALGWAAAAGQRALRPLLPPPARRRDARRREAHVVTAATKALVSIIAPVYNEEAAIAEFVERVRATIAPLDDRYGFEIILVDDGSRDRSLEIMRGLIA